MLSSSRDELAVIAREAVALQPEAEDVMAECVAATVNGQSLARKGSRVALGFHVLRQRLREVDGGPERDELDKLINFHHQVVEGCLELAYRDARTREHVAVQFQGRLGDAGERLRRLADALGVSESRPQ